MDTIGPSQTLPVDGLTIVLRRKRVRYVNLRVTRDCRVCVSAPQRVPTSRIEAFVRDRRPWIERQLARQASLDAALSARTFSPGEKTYVWGTPYDLRLIRDDSLRKPRASVGTDARVEIVGPSPMLDDAPASIDARREALREMGHTRRGPGHHQPCCSGMEASPDDEPLEKLLGRAQAHLAFNRASEIPARVRLLRVHTRALPPGRGKPWDQVPCDAGTLLSRLAQAQVDIERGVAQRHLMPRRSSRNDWGKAPRNSGDMPATHRRGPVTTRTGDGASNWVALAEQSQCAG